jgi:hypothetical protein
MVHKWYRHNDKIIQVFARKGVIGDYWIIPELNVTVTSKELFDTIEACAAGIVDATKETKEIEKDIGRATWIPYLRVIDGKKS